jgi:FkbM family methyltransferase
MLINLHLLKLKYNIQFKGILHVGAHECEELNDYEIYLSRDKILWIEGIQSKVEYVKYKYDNLLIENAIVSDKEEYIQFYVSNNYQSSSIFELGKHTELHPHIHYTDNYLVHTKKLSDILVNYNHIPFNFINLDIQGAELKALKGMENYLNQNNIDYIYTEVNGSYVYKNCNLIHELDEYLSKFSFKRVETSWYNNDPTTWGDAFYVK